MTTGFTKLSACNYMYVFLSRVIVEHSRGTSSGYGRRHGSGGGSGGGGGGGSSDRGGSGGDRYGGNSRDRGYRGYVEFRSKQSRESC